MTNRYSYTDKNGSFTLEKQGLIAVVHFKGCGGRRLTQEFSNAIQRLATQFQPHYWGYLSISPEAEAGTQEAEDNMAKALQRCLELGCKVEAHCLTSRILIEQTRRARALCGIEIPIEQVLFDTPEQAMVYIKSVLASFNAEINQ